MSTTHMPWTQRITIAVLGAAALFVLGVEGVSAETVLTAVGVVICGMLALAALFQPALVVPAAAASVAFSITCTQLPTRLDNTFGTVELVALSWLIVRVLMVQPLTRAAWVTPLLSIAVALLPLRLDAGADEYREFMIAGAVLGAMVMVLLGLYLRLYDRRRADGYELARQNQRLEYARDLHDFVAHHITAIVAQTKAIRYTTAAGTPPSPAALDQMLDNIEKVGSEALVFMRSMITVLRGDEPPPRQRTLLDAVNAAVTRFPGQVTTTIDETLTGLPTRTVEAAQHVVRESLTNVLRHATDVTTVEVDAHLDNGDLKLTVTNDGRHTTTDLPTSGVGLTGLTERVAEAGGHLKAGPTASGWQVTATLPS